MGFKRTLSLSIALLVFALTGGGLSAQNLQSVSNYSNRHDELLARQSHIQEQINLEETEEFATSLYEDEDDDLEPEPDIYTEGWESGLVNPYKNALVPDEATIDVSGYVPPCLGIVTSNYGYRRRFRRMHRGIDLRASIGDTIVAAFDGRVRLTNYERRGYGKYVIIRHPNGLETVYGHLSKFLVEPNQDVKAGEPIALAGNTGRSTGPHLHFETRFMGYAINPAGVIDFEKHEVRSPEYSFSKSTYEWAPGYKSANKYKKSSKSAKGSYIDDGKTTTYKIRKGDSLSKIARMHGTTVEKLCQLNGLKKTSTIQAGQVIRVR